VSASITDRVLPTFLAESREVLQEMEDGLLAVGQSPDLAETINAIFRAAHTIKGSAGLFDLADIVKFTHVVETVLDGARQGRVEMSSDLISLLLLCVDHIRAMVEEIAAGRRTLNEALGAQQGPLLERLARFSAPAAKAAAPPAVERATPAAPSEGAPEFQLWDERSAASPAPGVAAASTPGSDAIADHDRWHLSIRFGRNVLRNGMEPLSILNYLGKVGTIRKLVTIRDPAGLVETMDPESCYLGFEIAFESTADKAAIEGAFEFVRDDCRLNIIPPRSRVAEYLRLIHDQPDGVPALGQILVRCGSITERELEAALKVQSSAPEQKVGAILVQQEAVSPGLVDAAVAKQAQLREARSQDGRSIRVDAEKLDNLINLVGELIIAAARTDMVGRRARSTELQECTSSLSTLVQHVRDSALQLRMVKIAATFNRFQRVVHDVSRELGKDIGLVVAGEETELDKTVVEKISDPLMHLVRNAIDHGIEPADVRAARGKPARGTVKLNAFHDSGSIVIEVSDDGGGLRKDRIVAKATERGLIEAGRKLSDREIYALIFEPGFSTAETVTNLSGRGVGMDVVKRNIVALRGSVDVRSEEGVGTTVTVRMPLTLAMINGFLVGLGNSVFVIPLDMIDECLELSAEPGHDYTNVRGQVLPFVRLRDVFAVEGARARRESIVVVNYAGRRAGLVVDTLLGEFQTVIKPLGRSFQHVRCIGGATILGTGDVALIVDVPALLEQSRRAAVRRERSADRGVHA